MPTADWYDTPLYYDIIFDQDTEKEADFLEAMMARHATGKRQPPWRVLEPACGSGRLMMALAMRGHEVAGFDLNRNMTDYTRRRLDDHQLPGHVWEDRMEDFKVPGGDRRKFDLAHCLVSTFKYVLEGPGAVAHLQRAASVLRKGGLYILGIHLTDYHESRPQVERWSGERNGIRVSCTTRTWPADQRTRLEPLRTRLRITRDGKTWIQETRWQFRTYNARQVRALLRQVPEFDCLACHDFLHDPDETRQLDDSYPDIVLVLRRN